MVTEPVNEPPPLTVLYDGPCPLCRREIGIYSDRKPNTLVCFVDVSDAAAAAAARHYARSRVGELLSGAQAFLALWAVLPGWRWLARAGRLPGAAWAMARGYRLFLRWGPMLQGWASRLERQEAPR
jgi:predicted DCC family thiol-disulfide oxidoreductase YuxK